MEKISAVILTYNASGTIAQCLDALTGLADEIIIVDNNSTDNTAEICRRYPVTFITQDWLGFGPQKNVGINKASYNSILALDADEVLDEQAIAAIRELKTTGLKGVYEFKFNNFYFGKFLRYGLENPLYKNRFFDKRSVRWNDNMVHESLIIPANVPVIRLPGLINHYSYYTIEQYLTKANLYTSIGANELFRKGKKKYLAKIIFSPAFTFFQSYILKRGFLDGAHGFVVAIFNAHTNFLKYIKLWELCSYEKKKLAN